MVYIIVATKNVYSKYSNMETPRENTFKEDEKRRKSVIRMDENEDEVFAQLSSENEEEEEECTTIFLFKKINFIILFCVYNNIKKLKIIMSSIIMSLWWQ